MKSSALRVRYATYKNTATGIIYAHYCVETPSLCGTQVYTTMPYFLQKIEDNIAGLSDSCIIENAILSDVRKQFNYLSGRELDFIECKISFNPIKEIK